MVVMTTDHDPSHDPIPALGVVVDEDRGALPYALLHGDPLVAHAAWVLADAGVTPMDVGVPWSEVVDSGRPVVLQDALCPGTPPGFVVECLRRAVDSDTAVVGVRPVTDTVKVVSVVESQGRTVGETVDREGLVSVASPVVLPARLLPDLPAAPGPDLAALVSTLVAEGTGVEMVEAPPAGRRVTSEDEVRMLEAATGGGPRSAR
jgi:2-C-methyl-D-erythritol 4-phosphate cytidylyltransferase